MTVRFPYRPDVDGLRAIAIVAVVLHHLDVPGLSGGFVGVDVFFTISGFVIFSTLLGEWVEGGSIAWGAFFARRVRRLIPEATAMMTLVLLGSLVVFLPIGEQQAVAKAGVASSVWVANIYFWLLGSDYFQPSSARHPLLHLWSLGVEEQFYLLIPLLFVSAGWMSKLARGRAQYSHAIAVIALASFVLTAALERAHPLATFYLLPARAYEFLLGALLAVWRKRQHALDSERVGACLTYAGAIGVVASTCYLPETPQGAWTAVPTVCTGLVIWGCSMPGTNRVRDWLSARVPVYLGKVSYGWYLWHFPMLVFWRKYWLFDTSLAGETLVAISALVPAVVGYQMVSRLRRQPPDISGTLVAGAGALVAVFLLAGAVGVHARYVGSQTSEMKDLRAQVEDHYRPSIDCAEQGTTEVRCGFGSAGGEATVIIWGDSHAHHWIPALEPLFKAHEIRGLERVRWGCPPGLVASDTWMQKRYRDCIDFNAGIQAELERPGARPRAVILAARWSAYLDEKPLAVAERRSVWQGRRLAEGTDAAVAVLESALKQTIDRLNAREIPVGLLMQVPEQRFQVPECLARKRPDDCQMPREFEERYLASAEQMLARVARGDMRSIFDPLGLFCRSGRCEVRVGHTLAYVDDNHLSASGATAIGPELDQFVETLLSRSKAPPR